jgi:hypothetical protein
MKNFQVGRDHSPWLYYEFAPWEHYRNHHKWIESLPLVTPFGWEETQIHNRGVNLQHCGFLEDDSQNFWSEHQVLH